MYLNIHKNFGNCARFGSMLISSILGIAHIAGSPAHKGAKMSMEEVKEAAAKPRRKKKKL